VLGSTDDSKTISHPPRGRWQRALRYARLPIAHSLSVNEQIQDGISVDDEANPGFSNSDDDE